jgi:ribitol 2-dehydrogenase
LPPWFPAILVRASQLDFFHVYAGTYIREVLLNRTPEDWDPMLNLNINAVFRTADAARPRIIERGTGHIVVTNSIAGHTAVPVGAELHRFKSHDSGLRPRYPPPVQ